MHALKLLLERELSLCEVRLALGKLLFGAARGGTSGRGLLLGLGELAADDLQAIGQLACVTLTSAEAPLQAIELTALLALQALTLFLGLHAQLLLGILALLDPPHLVLALGKMFGAASLLLLSLAHTPA